MRQANHYTMLIKRRQTTDQILMIRPAAFGYNPQTAENNAFQQKDGAENTEVIQQQALKEFDAFVDVLRQAGIQVIVIEDSPEPAKPDAVFPNNWVSFHDNGAVITYPMYSVIRRAERREDIIEQIAQTFQLNRRLDFSDKEAENRFLEGTGSMIFDRVHRLVYACISPRTDEGLLDRFCDWAEYEKVQFNAVDANSQQIYHTNVMMALADNFVIICMDTIPDKEEKARLEYWFRETGKEVIEISLEQMNRFAGNMLQLANTEGATFLVMSEQAYKSLSTEQIERIENYSKILYSPIYTIEKYGGGSARCMLAEIFLPKQ